MGRASALIIAVAVSAGGAAADPPSPRADRTSACVAEAADLRDHLTIEAARMRRWNYAWAVAFGAAAVGQLALGLAEVAPLGEYDRSDQEVLYTGAVKASIGMAARLIVPLKGDVPAPVADACEDVVRLRAALATNGKRERQSFWLTHLGGTALNLAGAVFLTWRHSFEIGALSFAVSFPVGPTSAYTQPRRSWHKWREAKVSWAVGASTQAGTTSLWLGGTW